MVRVKANMKTLLSLFMLLALSLNAQKHYVKVYFLYGSKPHKCCKATERKWFGGLHGGHVSLGVDDEVIGFGPQGKFHIFSNDKNRHSAFAVERLKSFVKDTVGNKYVVVTIPLTTEQYKKLKEIHSHYTSKTPYDYAFMGMRCAAATYDILSQIGILKQHKRSRVMWNMFYPRRLRHKILRLAKEKGYDVYSQKGSTSRVWERD